jgi:hypothetical protein
VEVESSRAVDQCGDAEYEVMSEKADSVGNEMRDVRVSVRAKL